MRFAGVWLSDTCVYSSIQLYSAEPAVMRAQAACKLPTMYVTAFAVKYLVNPYSGLHCRLAATDDYCSLAHILRSKLQGCACLSVRYWSNSVSLLSRFCKTIVSGYMLASLWPDEETLSSQ